MDTATFIALPTAVAALGGIVFTALRYNRESATSVVAQQSQVVTDMKALNDRLHAAMEDLVHERDELKVQVEKLTAQVERLSRE